MTKSQMREEDICDDVLSANTCFELQPGWETQVTTKGRVSIWALTSSDVGACSLQTRVDLDVSGTLTIENHPKVPTYLHVHVDEPVHVHISQRCEP